MNHAALICPVCDSPIVREVLVPQAEARRDGRTLSYEAAVYECSSCEVQFETAEQGRGADLSRANALRAMERALPPESIRRLRESLNLTQALFECYLGVGKKTVVRWENGTVVPNRTADLLMRVLAGVPEARRFCSQHSGVVVKDEEPESSWLRPLAQPSALLDGSTLAVVLVDASGTPVSGRLVGQVNGILDSYSDFGRSADEPWQRGFTGEMPAIPC